MKATKQYIPVLLFILHYRWFSSYISVNKVTEDNSYQASHISLRTKVSSFSFCSLKQNILR